MKQASCPICQRKMPGDNPGDWPEAPFCSKRCKLIDLGRWLGEKYRVPADEPKDEAPSADTEAP